VKKYIVCSLLLHILLVLLFLWTARHNKLKSPEPFVASIVTPEELQRGKQPEKPLLRQKKEPDRMLRLPNNLPTPEKFSAIPSSTAPVKKSRSAERPEKSVTANTGSTREPPAATQEQGPSQEQGNNGIGDMFRSSKKSSSGRMGQNELFDRDIIAKFIPKKNEESSKDNGITFDTTEYKYFGYMQRLREKIEGIWKYPAEAEQRRLNGELYIRFTIKKDGTLAAAELLHTSGYRILDDAAIRALSDANPYWPLPDSWNQDSLTITGRFVYYFNTTYVR